MYNEVTFLYRLRSNPEQRIYNRASASNIVTGNYIGERHGYTRHCNKGQVNFVLSFVLQRSDSKYHAILARPLLPD